MTDYERGFMDKCAELGVDPVKLAGYGDFLLGGGLVGAAGRAAAGAGQRIGRGIRRGAQYLGSIPEQIGERIGNNYARWAAENPEPLTAAQQNERLRSQVGYANRTLQQYRRAHGVPHRDIAVPQHLMAQQPGAASQTPPIGMVPASGMVGLINRMAR